MLSLIHPKWIAWLHVSKKNDILEVATRLFSLKGFSDASMADLSKMTGVAEGTIFYHFKSKEDLFISVLEKLKKDIVEEFAKNVSEKQFQSGLDMAEDAVRFYLHLAGLMQDRFLLLHRHDIYQLAGVNSKCRGHLEAIYKCFLDILERAILRGKKDGSIADVSARKTSLILFSMVDGLVRFDTYRLYDAGSLYNELMESCRKILRNSTPRNGNDP